MRSSVLFSCAVILLLAVGGATGFAQSLAVTTNKTAIDGAVNASEYSFTKQIESMTLYANRTKDLLSLAILGDTTGWVSVGLGSLKMEGSTIFMGFVGNDGKVQFKTQAGTGHRHTEAPKSAVDSVTAYAIKVVDGKTMMEVSLTPAAYIKEGQSSLQIIWGVGEAKSFIPKHSSRGALSIKLN